MANIEEIMDEVNELLRVYSYLAEDDENLEIDDLPSLVSHLLLLRIFTQEGMRFGVKYEDINDFCEFCIDYIYDKELKGENIAQLELEIEDLVDAFRAKGLKH